MSAETHRRVRDYYRDQQLLFEEVAGGRGIYNLGWVPDGFTGDFPAAQRELVLKVADALGIRREPAPRRIRLLDTGCGHGGPAYIIARRYGAEVVGIDLLTDQLRQCRADLRTRETGRVELLAADAAALPFDGEVFQGVCSIESAFHYENKAAFVREAARVIQPGGRLAIADIMMNEGCENHWTHRGFQRALASPGLYAVGRYIRAAKDAGLELLQNEDLTRGVMRSLFLAGKHLGPKIPRLWRRGYPLGFLLLTEAAFLHLHFTHPLIPVEYRLLVFSKP